MIPRRGAALVALIALGGGALLLAPAREGRLAGHTVRPCSQEALTEFAADPTDLAGTPEEAVERERRLALGAALDDDVEQALANILTAGELRPDPTASRRSSTLDFTAASETATATFVVRRFPRGWAVEQRSWSLPPEICVRLRQANDGR